MKKRYSNFIKFVLYIIALSELLYPCRHSIIVEEDTGIT